MIDFVLLVRPRFIFILFGFKRLAGIHKRSDKAHYSLTGNSKLGLKNRKSIQKTKSGGMKPRATAASSRVASGVSTLPGSRLQYPYYAPHGGCSHSLSSSPTDSSRSMTKTGSSASVRPASDKLTSGSGRLKDRTSHETELVHTLTHDRRPCYRKRHLHR